jgi:hypothetical protein
VKTSEKANTAERVTVSVRPLVAEQAQELEASFARHDCDEAKNAWTGAERAYHMTRMLYRDASKAHELLYRPDVSLEDRAEARKALVRCGADTALALSLLDEESVS